MASLFLGDYAPIDFGDGSITNLLNINTKHWASGCLDVSINMSLLKYDLQSCKSRICPMSDSGWPAQRKG